MLFRSSSWDERGEKTVERQGRLGTDQRGGGRRDKETMLDYPLLAAVSRLGATVQGTDDLQKTQLILNV